MNKPAQHRAYNAAGRARAAIDVVTRWIPPTASWRWAVWALGLGLVLLGGGFHATVGLIGITAMAIAAIPWPNPVRTYRRALAHAAMVTREAINRAGAERDEALAACAAGLSTASVPQRFTAIGSEARQVIDALRGNYDDGAHSLGERAAITVALLSRCEKLLRDAERLADSETERVYQRVLSAQLKVAQQAIAHEREQSTEALTVLVKAIESIAVPDTLSKKGAEVRAAFRNELRARELLDASLNGSDREAARLAADAYTVAATDANASLAAAGFVVARAPRRAN